MTSSYKIILRHAKGWKNYKSARVHISVPHAPSFDPRNQSVLDWVAVNFDDVVLCLHDTIQRHNFMAEGMSASESYDRALKNGDLWLKENVLLSEAFIDIVRWDHLRLRSNYQDIYERVVLLYESNADFSAAVNRDINIFAERCRKRGEIFDEERFLFSQALLLEEITGYVILNQETSAVDLHLGMRMGAMNLLLNGLGDFNLRENLMVSVKTYPIVVNAMRRIACSSKQYD